MSDFKSIKDKWSLVFRQNKVETLRSLFSFFTVWWLVMLPLALIPLVQRTINFVLLATVVSIFGLFITYVYPKQIVFRTRGQNSQNSQNSQLVVSGYALRLFDILCHQLPALIVVLLYLFTKNFKITSFNSIISILILAIYIVFHNLEQQYGFATNEISLCAALVAIINIVLVQLPLF